MLNRNLMIAVLTIATMYTGYVYANEPSRDSGSHERLLQKEAIINASASEIFNAWTTSEGIATFFAKQSNVELRIGGPYELYMKLDNPPGKRGAEGCKILSYLPNKMLSFEWNAPPKIPTLRDAGELTSVVLQFDELSVNQTKVTLTQLGWGEGEDWDECYNYFDNAWSHVLNNLTKRFDDSSSSTNNNDFTIRESWIDGQVKVIVSHEPQKTQTFEIELPVSVITLWNALATTEGLRKLHGEQAFINLEFGGVISEWPGVENKILSYIPYKMMSGVGSAPKKFPNVQKGGTWWVYHFEPLGEKKSRLTMTLMGWKNGEKEWDEAFDYFLKANPQYYNDIAKKIAGKNLKPVKDRYMKQDTLIKASPQQIWDAFMTKEGMESWMVAHAKIDLRVGGKIQTHYDPKGVLGDEKTIENTILSYEPNKMFSLKATKPPAGFPCPNAIKNTWSVISMDEVELGLTRVSCIGLGYGDDEESKKLLTFFRWGNAWTLKELQKKFQ